MKQGIFFLSAILAIFAGSASAATLQGSVANAPSTYDLTANSADWVHFGYIPLPLDRKAGVAPQISDWVPTGGADPGSTDRTVVGYSWTDGTAPAGTMVESRTGKRVFQPGRGMEFTVPAKRTQRTLRVYVGAYASVGTLTASLSDNSAPVFTTTVSAAAKSTVGHVVTINFRADSDTAKLVVRYSVAKNNQTGSWITLDSAALTEGGSTGAPVLTGSNAVAPSIVNLTAVGPADWVHWGRIPDQPTDRKAGVLQRISGHGTVGHDVSPNSGPTRSGASWSDGSPHPQVTNTQTGIRVFGQDKGMSVNVAADRTVRTVEVYVGANNKIQGRFRAQLSDGSAPAYTYLVNQSSGRNTLKFTLTFQAATDDAQLQITYVRTDPRTNGTWISLESVKLLGQPTSGGGGTGGGGSTGGTASLGDLVWRDDDGDGVQDSAETGLPGVGVRLTRCGSTTTLASTTTDGNGNFLFDNLAAGDYALIASRPDGYSFSPRRQGSDRARDSDATADGVAGCATLNEGQAQRTFDIGLVPSSGGGSGSGGSVGGGTSNIGDRVWRDANGNGIQDSGEAGVGGVPVQLLDCSANQLARTTTASNGTYLFSNLPAGSYNVRFIRPSGTTFTTRFAGSSTKLDSNANPDGFSGCFSIGTGTNRTSVDAGLR
jgi:hypothetical protein